MLVLSRKPGESIVCNLASGETIRIKVIRLRANGVTLGIEAPNDVGLWRAEIANQVHRRRVPALQAAEAVLRQFPSRPEDPNDPEDLELF